MHRGLQRYSDLLARMLQYALGSVTNRFSRRPVTGDANVAISLTSHGRRLRTVHHAIESIAAGEVRPGRLILALDSAQDRRAVDGLKTLRRLRRRGLEVIEAPKMGPHAKYFPYVNSIDDHTVPLVTADDDIVYPRDWLRALLAAHSENPSIIHCFRAHSFGISGGRPSLYVTWGPVLTKTASYGTFLTGVSGVIYPPSFLNHLRKAGDAFREVSPQADDVWLHAQAVNAEIRVSQISDRPRTFPVLLGTQISALWRHNTRGHDRANDAGVLRTPNDDQIAQTYSDALVRRIIDDGVLPPAGGITSNP